MYLNGCACLNEEGDCTCGELSIITAVVAEVSGDIKTFNACVVTFGTEIDSCVVSDNNLCNYLDSLDVRLVVSGFFFCSNVLGKNCNETAFCNFNNVNAVFIGFYVIKVAVYKNCKLTVALAVTCDSNSRVAGNCELDLVFLIHLSGVTVVSHILAFNDKVAGGGENACEVARDSCATEYVCSISGGADNVDRNEIVVRKTCVNYGAILFCNVNVHRVEGSEICFAFSADSIGNVLGIVVRINYDSCTCLNREGNCTLDLVFAAVKSEATFHGNSLVVCNDSVVSLGLEGESSILYDLYCCIGILIVNSNGCALAAVCEYYCVFAFCGSVNCACVDCAICCCEVNDRAVGVDSLNYDAFVGKLFAKLVVRIHTFNLDLGECRSLGSFFIEINDDRVEIAVTYRHKCYYGFLCVVLGKDRGVGCANAVKCEVVIACVSCDCYERACRNCESDECAGLHIKSVCILVPSNVAVLCADVKTIPIKCSTLSDCSGCIECVGCACSA